MKQLFPPMDDIAKIGYAISLRRIIHHARGRRPDESLDLAALETIIRQIAAVAPATVAAAADGIARKGRTIEEGRGNSSFSPAQTAAHVERHRNYAARIMAIVHEASPEFGGETARFLTSLKN